MQRLGKAKRFVVVMVSCPTLPVARRITRHILGRRLAACVNIIPGIESNFWWQGKIDRCREHLLIIKTADSHFQKLKQAIIAIHPYEIPEVLALSLASGHTPYLEWVLENLILRP